VIFLKVKELLKGIEVKSIIGDVDNLEIEFLCDDSNKVQNNSLFVAIKGLRVDAHNFAQTAIDKGATCLVVERLLQVDIPQILVENTREVLAKLANNFYNNVTEDLKIISIIGTNGKTTTSYLIKDILENANIKVGVVGTSGIFICGKGQKSNLTTPDTLELFELFNQMKSEGVQVVVMEVSAHAIKLNKVSGFKADIAVFTNFSQDHLDFFDSLEDYKQTKMNYFKPEFCNLAVINVDDEVGQELYGKINLPILTYGIKNPSDVFCIDLKMNLKGSSFFINLVDSVNKIKLNLPAKFNIYNALAAACSCFALGIEQEQIINGLNNFHKVDGRFNIIEFGKNCNVIIDYAHTPEAIRNLLKSVKKLSYAKNICVFGCPGNREQKKRSITGKIVGENCDFAIITSDNPDLENPNIIFEQIESGLKRTKCPYKIVEDRAAAIKLALTEVKKQEKTNILLLGKGSEDYQIINGLKSPYNDEEELKKIIKSKG
jgi:UDP-N-acetylmuramoyl-L-alanyl-D-glutamate--2,6-diaminopimelate ligase